jgi:hypothetical protein
MPPATPTKDTAPAGALPAILDPNRVEYRPSQKVHLTEAGEVALTSWVGRVGDRRVRVYRGAQRKAIPAAVVSAYLGSGCTFGIITLADLGLRSLPGGRMPRIPTASTPE